MVWAILVGSILGSGGADIITGGIVLVCMVVLKGIFEIAFAINPVTRTPSPYQLYIQNLQNTGGVPAAPWKGFLVQHVIFGTLLGSGAFLLTRAIFG